VAFGDSLTQGQGASDGNDYPSVLAERLGVRIVNLRRSGDTTADALARLDALTKLKPRVVLVCLGGNDGLQGRSPQSMIANLRTIITRLQQEGAFVVLIGVRSPSLRDRNAKLFRQLAQQTRVFDVPDILQGVLGHPSLMADPLHPNDEGYRRIAERLEQVLRALLPKIGR